MEKNFESILVVLEKKNIFFKIHVSSTESKNVFKILAGSSASIEKKNFQKYSKKFLEKIKKKKNKPKKSSFSPWVKLLKDPFFKSLKEFLKF